MTHSQKTILVVEDEYILAMNEETGLMEYGYNVVIACSGEAAIQTVNTTPNIDLILMDINLGPGMDGTETAAVILQTKNIPIVFCSSHTEPEIVEKTEKITSYGYVVKSSSMTVLDASIKMAFKLFDANKKKHENELLLNETGRIARIGGWKITIETNELTWSQEVFRIHETEPGFIPTIENAIAFYDTASREIISQAVARAIETGTPFDLELGIITAGGNSKQVRSIGNVHANDRGHILSVYGSLQDVTEQKKNQEERTKEQTMLRMIIDTIPQSIFWKDTQSVYLGCNQVFAEAAGLSDPHDIIGKTDYDLPWKKEESDAYRADDKEVITTGKPKFNIIETLQQIDGKQILVDTTKIPLRDEAGNSFAILGVYEDITERREIEEQLIRTRKSIELSTDALFWVDNQGRIVDVNETACQMLGYSCAEMGDLTVADISSTFTNERWNEHFREIREKGCVTTQTVHLTKTGESIPVEVTSHYMEIDGKEFECAFVRNISQLVETRSLLTQEDLKYKAIFDNVNDAIFRYDPDTFEILEANKATEKLYGYSHEELIGMSCLNFSAEVEASKVAAEKIRNEGRAIIAYRHHRKKDGSDLFVHLSGYKLQLDDSVIHFSVCTDMTDQKKAEDTIREQLIDKETLLKEVHHRIKNNIASVEGFLNLQKHKITNPEAVSILQDAISRVESLRSIYDSLLIGDSYRTLPVDLYLKSLITSIISIFPERERITCTTHIPRMDLCVKKLFPLGLVVNELITNTMKYGFPDNRNGSIIITVKRDGEFMTLIVEDDGIGLPGDFILEESKGFGLFLVKMLARQLDGTIEFSGKEGTRAQLIFPADDRKQTDDKFRKTRRSLRQTRLPQAGKSCIV